MDEPKRVTPITHAAAGRCAGYLDGMEGEGLEALAILTPRRQDGEGLEALALHSIKVPCTPPCSRMCDGCHAFRFIHGNK